MSSGQDESSVRVAVRYSNIHFYISCSILKSLYSLTDAPYGPASYVPAIMSHHHQGFMFCTSSLCLRKRQVFNKYKIICMYVALFFYPIYLIFLILNQAVGPYCVDKHS